jgi:hypothetical protein
MHGEGYPDRLYLPIAALARLSSPLATMYCDSIQMLISLVPQTFRRFLFVQSTVFKMSALLPFITFAALANAREIVFPPTSGYTTDQVVLSRYNDPDISQAKFAGLNTYANLPYVHCLAGEGEEVEKFDIAVLGAPFDTVSIFSPHASDLPICRELVQPKVVDVVSVNDWHRGRHCALQDRGRECRSGETGVVTAAFVLCAFVDECESECASKDVQVWRRSLSII